MARVKKGISAHKRRKHLLQYTKGFKWGRKSKVYLAKQATLKGWSYAFRDRKNKKRTFRALWQIKIGGATRALGLSYSKFIAGLKKNKIEIDRKILSQLAQKHPEIFNKIVERVRS